MGWGTPNGRPFAVPRLAGEAWPEGRSQGLRINEIRVAFQQGSDGKGFKTLYLKPGTPVQKRLQRKLQRVFLRQENTYPLLAKRTRSTCPLSPGSGAF